MAETLTARAAYSGGGEAVLTVTFSDVAAEAGSLSLSLNGLDLLTSSVSPATGVGNWSRAEAKARAAGPTERFVPVALELHHLSVGNLTQVRGSIAGVNLRTVQLGNIEHPEDLTQHLDGLLPEVDLSNLDDIPLTDLTRMLRTELVNLTGENPTENKKKCKKCRAECTIDFAEHCFTCRKIPEMRLRAGCLAIASARYAYCYLWGCPC